MIQQGPARNRRGHDTRRVVVSAGIELLEEMDTAELLALLSVPSLASRSGRSERSVRHHFSEPADFHRALVELSSFDGSVGDHPHTEPAARLCDAGDEQLTAWAVDCAELFADGVDHVSWADIATATGVPNTVLRACFPTKRWLAGAAFGRHLPAIREAGERHLGSDPDRPLADALCELVRRARDDRHVASALLDCRVTTINPEVLVDRLVPLDATLVEFGNLLDARAARRIVNTCLALAGADRCSSPAEIAELATRVA